MQTSLTKLRQKLEAIRYLINDETHSLTNLDERALFNEYQKTLDEAIELNFKQHRPQIFFLSVADMKQKDYITVKEFETLYGYGASWQKQQRSKIHDPLPRVSEHGKKILYNHKQIKEWLENNIFR